VAKFNYKLQPILNLKKQMEESVKNELGKAIQALEDEKKVLEELNKENNRCMTEVSAGVLGGLTIDKLRNYNAYISFIKQKIINQSEKVNVAQQNVDKHREKLVAIVKERKMLETLKEKKYAEYLREQQKQELKFVDEIISYKQSAK